MTLHEIPLERRTLHGHFSRDLEPILTVDAGDSIAFSCLNAGWRGDDWEPFAERRPDGDGLDAGHALIGPVEVRGARAGQALEVRIEEMRIGSWGVTDAGGWHTPLNERLGVADGEPAVLAWKLDADTGVGRDQHGREVRLRPFLGVIGMPPDETGVHSTGPPRACGGNIDCKELVAGTTLFLPIPVDGALVSAGDGHAAQGDGEVSQLAIEAPVERAQLTLDLRDDLVLASPIAWTAGGLADVRLRRGSRRGRRSGDRRDARSHGARARSRAARGARVGERRRRPSRDADGERCAGSSRSPRARRSPLDDNPIDVHVGRPGRRRRALRPRVRCVSPAAWLQGRLGRAGLVLFVVALVVWVAAFLAIAAELRGANDFATCGASCAPVHYLTAVAFIGAAAADRARRPRDARRTR